VLGRDDSTFTYAHERWAADNGYSRYGKNSDGTYRTDGSIGAKGFVYVKTEVKNGKRTITELKPKNGAQ
jgi:hypothetical protein